jgi:glycosyltransferase involved in cell wall biosynthesis
VADFRDPWTTAVIYSERGWRLALDHALERKTHHFADRVVCVNHSIAQDWPDIVLEVIENGFDSSDLLRNGSESQITDGLQSITLLHLGTIYSETLGSLIQALLNLDSEGIDRLCFVQVGWTDPRELGRAKPLGERGLGEFRSRVPKPEAMALMSQASVLVLLLGTGKAWSQAHRGKLFEYMASGRPILAIAPDGVAADLVRRSGTGCVIRPDDIDGIANALRQIALNYEGFVRQYYHPDWNIIGQYERRRLTKRLADVFDQIMAEKEGKRERTTGN